MSPTILFAAGRSARWSLYEPPLRAALTQTGLPHARIGPQEGPPETVDYIVYTPDSGLTDFSIYPRLKAVLSLWAGVEKVIGNPTLTVPLCRMADRGLCEGMVEWVSGHVLRHHLDIDRALAGQSGDWTPKLTPLARHRPVTILGLGALGGACARALAALNFPVTGWSRTPREIEGITCLHGPDGLIPALSSAGILILLLPHTAGTDSLLDAERLRLLPRGAVILNPGRGSLIEDNALLAALDSGHLRHATLDVFRTEPLPRDHPYWAHPRVTVTPHIAAATRPETAAQVIVENIRRHEAGLPLLHLADPAQGY